MSERSDLMQAAGRVWQNLVGTGQTDLIPLTRFSGPMPWVIAIMVALTVIALSAGLALSNAARSAQAELEGGMTIQIVEARDDVRETQTKAVLARLQTLEGITSVRRVPQAEVDALIEPWLGSGAQAGLAQSVPVPTLIDARVEGSVTPGRLTAIQQALTEVAPAARVDAQSSWIGPVFDAIQSLQWLALALVVLLAMALTSAVLLAARSALGASRNTIEIVHLLGGTDAQIARIFQRSIGIGAAGGGIAGLLLAIIVILFLGKRFASLGAGLVDSGALGFSDWLLLAMVPVFAAGLAMLTARLTVIHTLRKML